MLYLTCTYIRYRPTYNRPMHHGLEASCKICCKQDKLQHYGAGEESWAPCRFIATVLWAMVAVMSPIAITGYQ